MALPSYSSTFTTGQLARTLGALALSVLGAACLLHIASRLEILPAAVPSDLDHTLLAAKARLAAEGSAADVILVGDSSCLTDIDAPHLARVLGRSVLNLGTLSYLDLEAHRRLLQRYFETHPGSPRVVLLLLHPEALWHAESTPGFAEYLADALARKRLGPPVLARSEWDAWLAGGVLRDRVFQPAIPAVLPGEFGARYGSNRQVTRELKARQGSLGDPSRFDARLQGGSSEYRLASRLQAASAAFRASLPNGVRLAVGITPVPDSIASSHHDATVRSMLATWAAWLQADLTLESLPFVLPESAFATRTHLTPTAAQAYTDHLARSGIFGP